MNECLLLIPQEVEVSLLFLSSTQFPPPHVVYETSLD